MVLYVRKKGSLPYIGSRTSEGIPWAKAFICQRSTCVSKARFQGWGHAKVGSHLDAFPNRPTTSRPPVTCNAQLLTDRSMDWRALNPIDFLTQEFSLGILKSIGSLSNSSRNERRLP
ncbi:hypothetical protein TNCV_1922591 [Trichonephila clavipes]|nr:hypothetical protein TNCV_1922591 [Trichonephila clavipes]